MIVSLISHDNRKRRRTLRARARKAGISLAITRVASAEVAGHIVTLTDYLTNPSPQALRALLGVEAPEHSVLEYIGSAKREGGVEAAELAEAIEEARRERVVQVLTRNLLSDELADIQLEMALVAGLSPAGEDPIEHLVVSWRDDEVPSPEHIEEALDILLAVMGMSRHQAYAVVHGDTDNRHLHVAVNRVDPATGTRLQIGLGIERPLETLHQAITIIEHRQGWVPQDAALYSADENGCYDRATGIKVRDEKLLPCSSAAQQQRIRELRTREREERKISPRARDYERRTGHESLQRRVLETAAPALRTAEDWEAVHRGLAAEGMRYRLLTSGAVIECGDRTIAASTAWGGASADKMAKRLGLFQPPPENLQVPEFVDRIIPALGKVAAARREELARREARQSLNVSVAGARQAVGLAYQDRVAAAVGDAPDNLNAIRRQASQELEQLSLALQKLRSRRRRRGRERGDDLVEAADEFGDEHEPGAGAILIGPRAAYVPPEPDPNLVDAGYQADVADDLVAYRRGSRLCFVDRGDRIDVYGRDDDAMRDALRLAHKKWGKVHACGDKEFLEQLVLIAVEEGIELTNHELQPHIEAARRVRAAGQAHRAPIVEPPATQVAPAAHLHKPDILRDYAPAFAEWIDLANAKVTPARANAKAAAITANPELARQLAELESQQFAFARELRKAAQRFRAWQLALQEQDREDDVPWPRDGLPCLRERPGEQELALMGIVLAPGSDDALPVQADDHPPAIPLVLSQPTQSAKPPGQCATDLDDRYLEIAAARRRAGVAELESDMADALRARVGSIERSPRHIARLVLRDAERHAAGSAGRRVVPNANGRDVQELGSLRHDPKFAQLAELARAGDEPTLASLRKAAVGRGDVLGRVKKGKNGRLNFAYRSMDGHDPDARPPWEWLERSLQHFDLTKVRLTHRNGRVGLTDEDLLEATHYNFVALLYPNVQARLEVEWRLQRERDVALLARIGTGEVQADIELRGNARDFEARIRTVRGATTAERDHLAAMMRDPEGYVSVREVIRNGVAEKPLHASVTAAAVLRARADGADPAVRQALARRLQDEDATLATQLCKGDFAGTHQARSGRDASTRRSGTFQTGRGVKQRPPLQPAGRSR